MRIATGQITTANSPQPLTQAQVECSAFVVKALSTNTAAIEVMGAGTALGQGYPLDPGETIEYARNLSASENQFVVAPSDVYVAGNGDLVAWLASQ